MSELPRLFPTTHWSLIESAADVDGSPAQRRALTRLLEGYTRPLLSHLVRRKRLDPHEAEDVLQAFLMSHALDGELFRQADRTKGRFRSYLLTTLDHFTANHFRSRRAKKRAPDQLTDLEHVDPADQSDRPGDAFDVEWARAVLQEAVRRVRAECDAANRSDVWGVFRARILAPALDGSPPTPYEQLIEQFNFASPAQASNVLVTAKRSFARALRGVVGEYAQDESEIQAEIADLRRILSRHHG